MLLFFHSVFMCPNARRTTPPCVLWSRIFGSIWRCTSRWYVTMTPASIRPASSWTSVWQQHSLPLSLLALLHVIWRNPHHTHGQAHSVPFHTVWTNRQSPKVKGAQWWTDLVKWSEVNECEVNLVKWMKKQLSFLLQMVVSLLLFKDWLVIDILIFHDWTIL